MAWNEPGNNNKDDDKDPWGRNRKENNNQQPPDLDEMLRNFQQKLGAMFGGGKSSSSGSAGSMGLGFIAVIALGIYVLSGIYIVKPYEQAAVFQFGKFQYTVGEGPHWLPPIIRSKEILPVDEVKTSKHREQMLTKDENIVDVELSVQYRISNLPDYLFNVTAPENTIRQVTDSAMRQVVGHSTFDAILTEGRELIRSQIKETIVSLLNEYKAGILVVDVLMQPAKAPEQVKEAFDDVIKAREDEIRSINRADAYKQKRLPIAEGKARQMVAEAEAYKEQIVLNAQGDVARFSKLLPEYERAPTVTRERLYLEAMQNVLSNSSKVVIDSKGNNMMYLPIDKILSGRKTADVSDLSEMRDEVSSTVSNAVKRVIPTQARNTRTYNYRSRDSYSR